MARHADGFACRGKPRARFGFALAVFGYRVAVGDDPGAGLDMHDAVLGITVTDYGDTAPN